MNILNRIILLSDVERSYFAIDPMAVLRINDQAIVGSLFEFQKSKQGYSKLHSRPD